MTNMKKEIPTLSSSLQKELDSIPTVSGKIRFLHKKDFSRGDISRILNKRYQHVRNVLVEDERKKNS